MSKHKKALARICATPPSANVKWDELKAALESLGYETINKGGSRRRFYHREKDALICCHEPHPSPDVDKGCLASIAQHLKDYGFVKAN